VVESQALTERYGDKIAVDDLIFTAHPGAVTGFLRPNGAGKATRTRMIMIPGSARGWVTVSGRRYAEYTTPLRHVGAMLDVRAVHTGPSPYHPRRRWVDEVIELVGLLGSERKRAGGFSLRTGQRLGIAGALLGVLVLDLPVNGLDPQGILWIRTLLRGFAAEGRTVFVSSHLMSEMALTAEHLIVVGRGGLLADTSVPEFTESASRNIVRVRTTGGRSPASSATVTAPTRASSRRPG